MKGLITGQAGEQDAPACAFVRRREFRIIIDQDYTNTRDYWLLLLVPLVAIKLKRLVWVEPFKRPVRTVRPLIYLARKAQNQSLSRITYQTRRLKIRPEMLWAQAICRRTESSSWDSKVRLLSRSPLMSILVDKYPMKSQIRSLCIPQKPCMKSPHWSPIRITSRLVRVSSSGSIPVNIDRD